MFASISSVLALLPFVSAAIHSVTVGGPNAELVFSPEALSAAVGDQVVFTFNPKNHSVSQSAFANPCGHKDGGFNSGFMPVAANLSADARPTFTVTVNDTDPVWVYCGQAAGLPASHCGQGMVFSINCPSDDSPNSFTNFKKAALAIGASLSAAAASATATGAAATGYGYGYPAASPTVTAAYGDVTIPPAVSATLVTVPITLDSTSTWTTVYTSFENSPAATPVAAEGAVHTVTVGGTGKLFFDPDHIVAAPRDTVVFQFAQKNHSVVQSSFADPCRPLNAGNASAPQGFISGFHPVGANDTVFPTWSLTVNDTAPIWAYCAQTTPSSHCGAGMVFAINAVDSTPRNFSAFQALAETLNGTGSASASASATGALSASASVTGALSSASATTGSTGGALSLRASSGAGVMLALAAVVASLL